MSRLCPLLLLLGPFAAAAMAVTADPASTVSSTAAPASTVSSTAAPASTVSSTAAPATSTVSPPEAGTTEVLTSTASPEIRTLKSPTVPLRPTEVFTKPPTSNVSEAISSTLIESTQTPTVFSLQSTTVTKSPKIQTNTPFTRVETTPPFPAASRKPHNNLQTATPTTKASSLTSGPTSTTVRGINTVNNVGEIVSQLPGIAYLLQERQSLVKGLSSLAEKMDNLTLALASHLPSRTTSQISEENRLLLQENRQLRRDQAREESEKTELTHRLAQSVREAENATRLLQEIRARSKQEKNNTRSRTELMLKETEEQREINRKTGEEKRRLEEKLAEMENLIQMMNGNSTKLEQENEQKDQEIRETEEENIQIEEKNRLMAEELEGCKIDVGNLARRPAAPRDCAEVYCSGVRRDGVYTIAPFSSRRLVSAWCDMTAAGGGWTVFLKRKQAGIHEDFSRDWVDYRRGFGRVWGEYWLGLESLHRVTSPRHHPHHHLRLAATNQEGEQRAALWNTFRVSSEQSGYKLLVGDYDSQSSTLGDSFVTHHDINGRMFSTKDRDNDDLEGGDCVAEFSTGGGWWYRRCSFLSPTGPHAGSGKHMLSLWSPGNFTWISLENLSMMVRPATFPDC